MLYGVDIWEKVYPPQTQPNYPLHVIQRETSTTSLRIHWHDLDWNWEWRSVLPIADQICNPHSGDWEKRAYPNMSIHGHMTMLPTINYPMHQVCTTSSQTHHPTLRRIYVLSTLLEHRIHLKKISWDTYWYFSTTAEEVSCNTLLVPKVVFQIFWGRWHIIIVIFASTSRQPFYVL